jgi:large subunit ribosomal protein L4
MSPEPEEPQDAADEVTAGASETEASDAEASETAAAEADATEAQESEAPETVQAQAETPEADEAQAPEASEAEADAEAEAPAKPARRRAAKASASEADDSAPAKPARGRAAKAQPASKPKREPAVASHEVVDTDLPAEIFDVKVNVPLIHQVVVAKQAAARQGTHSVKSRGDVRGGGRKPYRQKGTGRARQGSIRAPHFTGGGVVHGPVPRSYEQKTPKKMKAAALRGALSDRARHGLIQVIDGFVAGDVPKTRDAIATLNAVMGVGSDTRSVLVVAQTTDQATWRSLRNAPGVHLIDPGQLNTYDVLVSDRVVFTTTALASFVARAGSAAGRADREDAKL